MLELIGSLEYDGGNFSGITYHKILLPDPAVEPCAGGQSGRATKRKGTRTFTVNA